MQTLCLLTLYFGWNKHSLSGSAQSVFLLIWLFITVSVFVSACVSLWAFFFGLLSFKKHHPAKTLCRLSMAKQHSFYYYSYFLLSFMSQPPRADVVAMRLPPLMHHGVLSMRWKCASLSHQCSFSNTLCWGRSCWLHSYTLITAHLIRMSHWRRGTCPSNNKAYVGRSIILHMSQEQDECGTHGSLLVAFTAPMLKQWQQAWKHQLHLCLVQASTAGRLLNATPLQPTVVVEVSVSC